MFDRKRQQLATYFWMNGVRCGEVAIDAGVAGDHVPTIMVSGDDKLCIESQQFIADVVTV
ncbi:MAG: M55 family metallopeptidase [Victivallaceae bacterium]|nr:M55 family metallopeptidase [Victivallaceae bacterium]